MTHLSAYVVGVVWSMVLPLVAGPSTNVTIAQLSDTHLGEGHSPQAADNLRKAVEMINARHPDAVVVSGDIGERPENRGHAKEILQALAAPVYYVPGNHDLHNAAGLAGYPA